LISTHHLFRHLFLNVRRTNFVDIPPEGRELLGVPLPLEPRFHNYVQQQNALNLEGLHDLNVDHAAEVRLNAIELLEDFMFNAPSFPMSGGIYFLLGIGAAFLILTYIKDVSLTEIVTACLKS
jgi:hypothetical protein